MSLDGIQADWVDIPEPTWWESIKGLRQRALGLLDGAYIGLHGEPVMYLVKNGKGSLQNQIFISPNRGEMLSVNPGLSRISRFLSQTCADKNLLVYDGGELQEVTHPEAVNEGLLKEKSYADIFAYNGEKNASRAYPVILETMKKLDDMVGGHENQESISETAYQVTKKGSGKLFLGERIIHRAPIILGGMRFKI